MQNSERDVGQLIKRHLKDRLSQIETLPRQDCPSELELIDYLEGKLSRKKRGLVLEHIADCSGCLSSLELAQQVAEKRYILEKPAPEMIGRAKNIMSTKSKRIIFNYRWQTLAFISFIFSFIFSRYFLQFLILAIIFSAKWIFDTGSTRVLIMIYEAWRKRDKDTVQKIIQGFQDRIDGKRR